MAASSAEDVVDQVSDTGTSTDTTAQTPNSDAQAGASSTPEKPAETLLDRVKTTLDKMHGASPAPETPSGTAEADPTKVAKPEDEDGLPADESKTLHPKTKERFGKLTSELKAAKTKLEELEPKAQKFGKIETFISNAGLSPQDVGGALQVAALLRSDPRAARERLQPIMAELDRMLGETLPAELQARVDQGLLTTEDAKALNRASADANLARRQATELTQRQQQEAQSRQQQTAIDSTLNAITTWEKQKAASDPDWHQKQPEISELVELAIERKTRELQRPYWPTPEEAVKLSEDALAKVGERYKRFVPKPKAIDPPVNAGASPRSTAAPKNTMDIIRRTVAGA
jgi:hypothetical protein